MICEYCNSEHDGLYGSGRFCCERCARGFASKKKRKEINKKVSQSLKVFYSNEENLKKHKKRMKMTKGWHHTKKTKNILSKKAKQKYIDNPNLREIVGKCSKERILSEKTREILSKRMIERLINGEINLKSKKCYYFFNKEPIRCDSKLEYSCLDFFVKRFKVISVKRCEFFIEYTFNGKKRRYLPDFEIQTKRKKFIVECKTFFSDKKLRRKWDFYYKSFKYKKKALEKYCKKHKFEAFFYNRSMNEKFYFECNPPVSPHSDKV